MAGTPINQRNGVRCSAASKRTGEPCGQFVEPGAKVCRWHGGGAPQVAAKVRERLSGLALVAVDTLLDAMEPGEDMPVRERAARTVLDRIGVGPSASLSVDVDTTALRGLTAEELARRLEERAAELRASDVGESTSEAPRLPDGDLEGTL